MSRVSARRCAVGHSPLTATAATTCFSLPRTSLSLARRATRAPHARRGGEPLVQSTAPRFPRRGLARRAASFLDYTRRLGALTNARDGLPAYARNGILGERLAGVTLAQRNIKRSRESAERVLAEFLEYDRRTRFTGEYLPKVDGATMHYALEARSPFLDQKLWEYAAALPFDLRLKGGTLKAVLRELARRRIGDVARGRKRASASGYALDGGDVGARAWKRLCAIPFWVAKEDRAGMPQAVCMDSSAAKRLADVVALVLETWMRHERSANVFDRPRNVERLTMATLKARETNECERASLVLDLKALPPSASLRPLR